MKKNKGFKFKGFTFIELLAAVTILGIISVIAISGVSRILERSHDEYYKNHEFFYHKIAKVNFFQKIAI